MTDREYHKILKDKEKRTLCLFDLEPGYIDLVEENRFEIDKSKVCCENLPLPGKYVSEIELDSVPGPDKYLCETIITDDKIIILFEGTENDIIFFESLRIFKDYNKRKVFLDMDGTLVDFVAQVNKYGYWLKENKVDWDKVIAADQKFWSEMDWMPGAEWAFDKLQLYAAYGIYKLYIFSSIDFEEGRIGEMIWIKKHTTLPSKNATFVLEPEYKDKYANSNTFLISAKSKPIESFTAAGGNTIEFTGNLGKTVDELFEKV